MKTKSVLAVFMIPVMMFGFASCKARERYLNSEEAVMEARPIRASFDYGRFDLRPGWTEVNPGSYEYTDGDQSYYLTVRHDTNDYTESDYHDFPSDSYDSVHQEFPGSQINVILSGWIEDDAAAVYEIETGDTYIVRWYRVKPGDQVTFELTTSDAAVLDSEAMMTAEEAVNFFHWNI